MDQQPAKSTPYSRIAGIVFTITLCFSGCISLLLLFMLPNLSSNQGEGGGWAILMTSVAVPLLSIVAMVIGIGLQATLTRLNRPMGIQGTILLGFILAVGASLFIWAMLASL